MAYTAPTAEDIKERFEEFASVSDTRIRFAIEEALLSVDQSWVESDYAPALRYLTAHLLVTQGALRQEGERFTGVTTGQIVSERIGDASVTYANSAAASGSGAYASTPYGQQFELIRRRNIGGPIVV